MPSGTDEPRNGIRWPIVVGGFAIAGLLTAGALTLARPDPAATPPADPADSLIGLWIDSVGGMDTYHRFQSATFTVTTVLYDTLSGRAMRSRPRYAWLKKGPYGEETRVERWESYGFIEQGFNGQTGWARVNGEFVADTAKDWREARYVARDLFYWIGLPFKLRDPGVHLTHMGLVSRPGAEFREDPREPSSLPPEDGYHGVEVTFGEGVGDHRDTWTYYFSPAEAFPAEVTYRSEGGRNLNRLIWSEMPRVGEIRYPYVARRDYITASGKLWKALVISDVKVNVEIPQQMFERPG